MYDLDSITAMFGKLSVRAQRTSVRHNTLQSLNSLLDKVATLVQDDKVIEDALLIEIQQKILSLLTDEKALLKLQAHNLKISIVEVLKSNHPTIKASKHQMVAHLHGLKYFRKIGAFNYICQHLARHGNPEAFRCLLDHKQIIPNSKLDRTSHCFLEESLTSIRSLDLFYKLNPEDFKHKEWSELTTYEKLYHIVLEKYSIVELSHRLGLEGQSCVQWHDTSVHKLGVKEEKGTDTGDSARAIDQEGQLDGHSFIQFRDSLLTYLTLHAEVPGVLQDVADEILAIMPMKHHEFRYRAKHNQSELFLLGLDDVHFTTAYLSNTGIYYEINLGFRPDHIKDAGVTMHAVPPSKMVDVHDRLCSLQYCGTTKAFHKISDDLELDLLASFTLPNQVVSNCTYENIRALVFVLAFDKLNKELTTKEAYLQAVQLYRQFCLFDVRNAPVKYCSNSLSPNHKLLDTVVDRLEQAEETIFCRSNYQALIYSPRRPSDAFDGDCSTPTFPVLARALAGP